MQFDKEKYLQEMKALVDSAIKKLLNENPDYEIYTVSIWTDANAAASSVNLDSKANSDKETEESNAWRKQHYEQFIAEGNYEQAALFEPNDSRNCNPADFELRDFAETENQSFEVNWEEESEGECWQMLEPALHEIGEYAFNQFSALHVHPEFELAVNGSEDWYQFTWKHQDN